MLVCSLKDLMTYYFAALQYFFGKTGDMRILGKTESQGANIIYVIAPISYIIWYLDIEEGRPIERIVTI